VNKRRKSTGVPTKYHEEQERDDLRHYKGLPLEVPVLADGMGV